MGNARIVTLDNSNESTLFFDDLYGNASGCDKNCNCKNCREERNPSLSTQSEQMQGESSFVENEMSDTSSFDAMDSTLPGAEDRYNDVMPLEVVVNPQVQDVANKIIWNKMLIDKLARERGNTNGKQNISLIIIERKKRMRELKDALDNYTGCIGENYANFDDMQMECKCRKIEVAKALNNAKNRKGSTSSQQGVIPVSKDLQPEFSEGKIMIPAEERNSNMTGLNGFDNVNDFDAPPVREFFVNADGKTTLNINWGSFLVGGIVAVGAIWAIKKYGLLKGL
jgi:hypothetical protein